MTTITVSGYLTGQLWWPMGAPYAMGIDETVRRADGGTPYLMTLRVDHSERWSLRDIIESLLMRHGGDSSSAPMLWGGSLVTIAHTNGAKRTYELARFPSVADYVSDDDPMFGDDDVAEDAA